MNLRRFLFTLFALALAPSLFAQSTARTFTLNAANQCATISATAMSTVGIQVTGTFSATLQPEVSIAGQSAQNTQVTPSNSNTAQSTITTTGAYVASVGGYDTFLVCVSAYTSGTATVWLNPSKGVNAGLFGGGSPAFNNITSGTNTSAAMMVSSGASLTVPTHPSSDNSGLAASDQFVQTATAAITPPQTLPNASSITTAVAIGDSITYPYGPQTGQSYASLLSAVGKWTLTNLGNPGSNIAVCSPPCVGNDQTTNAWAQAPSTTNVSLAVLGANDNAYSTPTLVNQLESSYLAFAAWLGLPAGQKTVVAGGNCTGSWSSFAAFGLNSEFSNTAGDSCSMTATGTTVYVVGWCGNTGQNILQESISIDGVSQGNFTIQAPQAIQGYAYRFPGLASGSHTIKVTVLTNGVRGILSWVGGNGAGTGLPPVIIGATLPNSSGVNIAARNTATQALVAQLVSDGLSVFWVDDNSAMSLTAVPLQFQADGIHPTVYGQSLVASLWIAQFFPRTLANISAFVNELSFPNPGFAPTRSAYMNPGIGGGPVTVNANVTTDQNLFAWLPPLGTFNKVLTLLQQSRSWRFFAAGVYSTPIASTATLEFKVKLCTVSGCGSGTVLTLLDIITSANPGTVTNNPGQIEGLITNVTAGSSATYEAHGKLVIDLGSATTSASSPFLDTNTAAVGTIDVADDQVYLQTTVAFSAGSASNSVTERQQLVEILGP